MDCKLYTFDSTNVKKVLAREGDLEHLWPLIALHLVTKVSISRSRLLLFSGIAQFDTTEEVVMGIVGAALDAVPEAPS